MRVNRQIRVPKIRLIDEEGKQVGVVTIEEGLRQAQFAGLDLVEVVPTAAPPVCKIIDYGKFRYDQTKREKEGKKGSHQIKIKEIKVKPNIDQHDLDTKIRHAREFLEKGHKVRVTCMYRGREMAHQEIGYRVVTNFCELLQDCSMVETPPKMLGRILSAMLAPTGKRKVQKEEKESAKDEN